MTVALDKMFNGPSISNGGHLHTNPIMDRNHYSSPSGHGYHQNYDTSSSHGSHKDGGKRSIALSALTLLAFLFFLNILQNCLHEQMEMNQNNGQQVLVLSSRLKSPREADKRKDSNEDIETIVETENSITYGKHEQEEKKYLQIAKRVLDTTKYEA